MKRFLTMLAAVLTLSAALCVTASAADFEPVAQELSAVGMFRGTGTGFELDRAPTRAEAAIMLVRLYGAEDTAAADYAAGKLSHPFTDVPEFAAPHIAWLYENGLAKGVSADAFGSTDKCSAQSYATFLLRALGYRDGTDFAYADALTFAQEKGFYSPVMFTGEFLRDDLAALTYQALAADTADGKTYLLAQLISDGAIDADAAKPMTEKMELYRAFSAVDSSMDENALDMSILMNMDMTTVTDGESEQTSASAVGNISTIVDGTDVQMAYLLMTTTDDTAVDAGIWMKDGWVYQYISDGATTQTVKYAVTDQLAALEELGAVSPTAMDVSALAVVKSITKETSSNGVLYTMVIREGFGGMMEGIMDLVSQEAGKDADISSMDLNIGEITITYLADSKGALAVMSLEMPYAMKLTAPDETGAMVSAEISCDTFMLMTVNATGKDVKIEYPDGLDLFADITPASQDVTE